MLKTSVTSILYAFLAGAVLLPAHASDNMIVSHGSGGFGTGTRGAVTCYEASRQENEAAVRATNATRRARGLSPLHANGDLARAAARHACDMAHRSVMSHRGSNTRGPMQRVKKTGYKPRIAAENIAAGPWRLERVLREWTRSQGHLANILIPQVKHYGIGKAIGADGRTVFWAAVYGAPRKR